MNLQAIKRGNDLSNIYVQRFLDLILRNMDQGLEFIEQIHEANASLSRNKKSNIRIDCHCDVLYYVRHASDFLSKIFFTYKTRQNLNLSE